MYKILAFLSLFLSISAYSVEVVECETKNFTSSASPIKKDTYVLTGPGKKYKKRVNENFTKATGTTQYVQLTTDVVAREVCRKNGFSFVEIVDPDWVRDSHRGWIPSENIAFRAKSEFDIIEECKQKVGIKNGTVRVVKGILYKAGKKDKWMDRVMIDIDKSEFYRCDFDNQDYSRIGADWVVNGKIKRSY